MKSRFINIKELMIGLASAIGAICLLFILANTLILPLYTKHWQQAELPDVVEYPFDEGRKILKDSGFKIVLDAEEFHPVLPESTIIFQKPAAYTKVKKGRRIYVTISAGEQLTQIPRLIGSSEREAILSIQQAKLEVGEISYQVSSYPKDVVCDQELQSNMEVTEKTSVGFTVSLGMVKNKYIVPDVLSRSYTEAERLIKKEGLRVGEIIYKYRPQLLPETVIAQSVDADTEVQPEQFIDLVISTLKPDSIISDTAKITVGDTL